MPLFSSKKKEPTEVLPKTEPRTEPTGPELPVKVPALFFRDVREEDLEQVWSIFSSTPELSDFSTKDNLEDEIRWHTSGGKFIVAVLKFKIIGFCYMVKEHQIACLYYITVLPEYRKNGIAKALIEECQIQLGVKSLYLFAATEEVSKIFGQLGFKLVRPTYYMTRDTK